MFRIGMMDKPTECPIIWDSGRPIYDPEKEVCIVVTAPLAKVLAERIVGMLNAALDCANDIHLREQGHNDSYAISGYEHAAEQAPLAYRHHWRKVLLSEVGLCPKCWAERDSQKAEGRG